jgi:hypothetical protein
MLLPQVVEAPVTVAKMHMLLPTGWIDASVGVVQVAYVASTGCGGISYCRGNWRLERDWWALWGRVLWWCIRKMM